MLVCACACGYMNTHGPVCTCVEAKDNLSCHFSDVDNLGVFETEPLSCLELTAWANLIGQ